MTYPGSWFETWNLEIATWNPAWPGSWFETWNGCSNTFKDGRRQVAETIEQFVRGLDPSTQDWCVLRVVKRNGFLPSADNRRLFAMQEAQRLPRESDPERAPWVRVKLYVRKPTPDIFLDHLDHERSCADGKRIEVRSAKYRRRI